MPLGRRRTGIALAAGSALFAVTLFAAVSPAVAQRGPSRPVGAEERIAPPRRPAQRPAPAQRQAAAGGGGALNFPGLPKQKPGAPAAPQRRVVPGFQLNAEDQAVVELVLKKWEQKNTSIKTFSCGFTLWEYNDELPLNPQERQAPREPSIRNGRLSYAAPDKGMYQEDPYPPKPGEEKLPPIGGVHWVCDGKSIYEVNHAERKIVERPLPEEMRGKAIADAPLPFVFGSTADKMQRRFWLRVSTPRRNFTQIPLEPGQVLLEAMPKTQQDAANFQLVQVIFQEKDMTIVAINEFLPHHTARSEHRLSYVFTEPSINSPLERLKNLFIKPTNKLGYTHEIDRPPTVEEPAPRPLVPSANAKSRGAQLPLRR